MLWNASAINGYAIVASDGRLGTISDFLFDDANWLIRRLVVDTGNWLSGRGVQTRGRSQQQPQCEAMLNRTTWIVALSGRQEPLRR